MKAKQQEEQEQGNGAFICPVADDWPEHRKEAVEAMGRIAIMAPAIAKIADHTSYLQKLESMDDTLTRLDTKWIDTATGKRQVPLVFAVFIVLLLASISLVILLEHSQKTVKITPTGIEIGNHEERN